ncbi:MAG: hypothetical protein ACRCU6_04315 [Fusobacteriaceae bacterium]
MLVMDRMALEYDMAIYFNVDQIIFKKLTDKEFEHLQLVRYSEAKNILDNLQSIREKLRRRAK